MLSVKDSAPHFYVSDVKPVKRVGGRASAPGSTVRRGNADMIGQVQEGLTVKRWVSMLLVLCMV